MIWMDTDKLMKYLTSKIESHEDLPWLKEYTSHGDFRPDDSPEGEISEQEIGEWLVIVAILRWDGTTMDQTTDRLSGDPYIGIVRYDWIGPIESSPKQVSKPEELDTWASLKLKYVCENVDTGQFGVHEGSWIDDFKADGTVTIFEAKGRYQDESPQFTTSTKTIQL